MVTKRYLQSRVNQLEKVLADVQAERDRYRTERDTLEAATMADDVETLRAQLTETSDKLASMTTENEHLTQRVREIGRTMEEQIEQWERERQDAALRNELEQYRALEKAREEARIREERQVEVIAI